MKKLIFSMIIVMNIAGCIPEPSNTTTYSQAQGKVIVENKDYSMRIKDFEWKEADFKTRKISESSVYELADQFNTLEVKKGDKLKIEIEQNPSSIIVDQWKEDGTIVAVESKGNEISLPTETDIIFMKLSLNGIKEE
ncbi:hypothetical protein WAX74_15090 [Psychrobacillus sp. FJAT-51614]|uniref:DUF3221 domain-containing protein n=1 Tax=Psychrobacillus mangrovi TaxID=3117745 RepID=A0ABU8F7F8_9BACI